MAKQLEQAPTLRLLALHEWQQRVFSQKKRFNVLDCARRWGKTQFFQYLFLVIFQEASTISQNQGNNPEGQQDERIIFECGYFSPSYKNLDATWRDFISTFEKIITYKSEQDHVIVLAGILKVEFWSLDKPKVIRGRKYRLVVIDEAAYIERLRHVFNTIILPTLADHSGEAWFMSSPNGFNDFHYFYEELGLNPLFPDWTCWQRPTSDNPYIKRSEIELARRLLSPEEFAQEYEAKFIIVGSQGFDVEKFNEVKSFEDALTLSDGTKDVILHNLRYWDLSDSTDGDFTASIKLSVTQSPRFILDNAFRIKGKWGKNYALVKAKIISEPESIHMIETDGIGSIIWQLIREDKDFKGYKIYPADRRFTGQGKAERAEYWKIELNAGNIWLVQFDGYKIYKNEIGAFPHGQNDDLLDSTSGDFLGFIYFCGGLRKLLKSKVIPTKKEEITRDKMIKNDLFSRLQDVY